MEEQKRRRRGDGCIYLQPGSPFYMMKFVYHGKVYVKSSERDEEHAAYTALQNWRSKIVSGTTSPGEHRVKVSELWDDVWPSTTPCSVAKPTGRYGAGTEI